MMEHQGVTRAAPRTGVWFVAGTSVEGLYLCRCPEFDAWMHQRGRCACWGRTDLAHLPWACCAWRYWRIASGNADH